MAIVGVMFACILVFMQLGFRDSLFRSATTLPRALQGQLFVIHPFTQAIWRGVSFSKREAFAVYAHPGVKAVVPVYIALCPWKNPETLGTEHLLALGYPIQYDVFSSTQMCQLPDQSMAPSRTILARSDGVLFDRLSKPEFGRVSALLSDAHKPLAVEVNSQRMYVLGTFSQGASFAGAGNIAMSDQSFFRIFPQRNPEMIDVGVVQLHSGQDPVVVREELAQRVGNKIHILTYDDIVQREENYWRTRTSIGFTFGVGVAIGLLVGLVVVYQILFTDVMNHLKAYATLCAMGYSMRYLRWVVVTSALWMALLGFVPGVLAARGLYVLTQRVTMLPMALPLQTVAWVWCLIFSMCALAGLVASRQLSRVDPAALF